MVEPETGLVTRLTDFRGDAHPAWSPDGDHIVFVSDRDYPDEYGDELYMMKANGKQVQRLTCMGNTRSPVWGPESKRIAFSNSEPSVPSPDFYILDMRDKVIAKVELALEKEVTSTTLIHPEEWSADGIYIYY